MGTHHRSEIGTLIEEVGEHIGKNLTISNYQEKYLSAFLPFFMLLIGMFAHYQNLWSDPVWNK